MDGSHPPLNQESALPQWESQGLIGGLTLRHREAHTGSMSSSVLSIGDFARAAHVSVKMLRHYHQIGLLEPADVDADTGYRRYSIEQLPAAQVIRRFRALNMPLDQIKAVMAAPDLVTRNQLIQQHLQALQAELSQTHAAIASLSDLLQAPASSEGAEVRFRRTNQIPAAAISQTISLDDASLWFQGAIGEILATLDVQNLQAGGAPSGIYSDDLFAEERGLATIFVPCDGPLRAAGRVAFTTIPAVELATLIHTGPHAEIDRAYGTLARYVASHALVVDGPIRETYLVGRHNSRDRAAWRTEIGWPIFRTDATEGRG
jgi:DNA-binding transcriptional MerR regulator